MPRPIDIRLACVALRCAGPLYERLVTLMPADLRRELLAIDPQATLHGMSLTSSARMRNVVGEDREAELRIRLFGGLQVERGGQRIGDEDWGRQKARRLLACLALYPERALSREHVARALWPDANYEAARSGLYAALTTLRGALGQKHGGPAFVLAVGDALRLNLELVEVDVRTFEHLARSVLARRDVLPAGDQLEVCARIEEIYGTGVNLSVDDLGIEGRMRAEELGQLYVDCMVHASHVAGESGNPQLALWFARAAKRASPYREDVCLVLMHALGTLSRRSAAADAYHEVVEHLDEEAGVGPSDELRQAYAQLVEGEDGQMPAPLPTTEGEFVDELVS